MDSVDHAEQEAHALSKDWPHKCLNMCLRAVRGTSGRGSHALRESLQSQLYALVSTDVPTCLERYDTHNQRRRSFCRCYKCVFQTHTVNRLRSSPCESGSCRGRPRYIDGDKNHTQLGNCENLIDHQSQKRGKKVKFS
jgi:hypothetical protein